MSINLPVSLQSPWKFLIFYVRKIQIKYLEHAPMCKHMCYNEAHTILTHVKTENDLQKLFIIIHVWYCMFLKGHIFGGKESV
jgi:hypothetical protein